MTSTCITGASGFVGKALSTELMLRGVFVKAAVRSLDPSTKILTHYINTFEVGNIGPENNWSGVLTSIDCVIHCAARAHIMNENKTDALAAYRAVNVDGTKNLAEQAAVAGVKRFIFLSTIKVNGEQTISGVRFCSGDNTFPEDAYGITKWEAEQALHEVSARTGLEVVVIRPPLVYGPRVKGNFLSMLGG